MLGIMGMELREERVDGLIRGEDLMGGKVNENSSDLAE
jgi:hypothetical protein